MRRQEREEKQKEKEKTREKDEKRPGNAFIHLFIDFLDKDYKHKAIIIIIINISNRSEHVFHNGYYQ